MYVVFRYKVLKIQNFGPQSPALAGVQVYVASEKRILLLNSIHTIKIKIQSLITNSFGQNVNISAKVTYLL